MRDRLNFGVCDCWQWRGLVMEIVRNEVMHVRSYVH